MAEGTRMKNFEAQLQQTRVVVAECQNKMEQLELGMTRNQEAILALDCRVESAMDGMERRLGSKSPLHGYGRNWVHKRNSTWPC